MAFGLRSFASTLEPRSIGRYLELLAAGRDDPGARRCEDSMGRDVGRKRFFHGREDLRCLFTSEIAGQANDLSCRPERHRKLHRLVHVTADANFEIAAL